MAWFPHCSLPGPSCPGGSNGAERGLSFRVTATPHQGKPMASVTLAKSWPHSFLLGQKPPRELGLTMGQ